MIVLTELQAAQTQQGRQWDMSIDSSGNLTKLINYPSEHYPRGIKETFYQTSSEYIRAKE